MSWTRDWLFERSSRVALGRAVSRSRGAFSTWEHERLGSNAGASGAFD